MSSADGHARQGIVDETLTLGATTKSVMELAQEGVPVIPEDLDAYTRQLRANQAAGLSTEAGAKGFQTYVRSFEGESDVKLGVAEKLKTIAHDRAQRKTLKIGADLNPISAKWLRAEMSNYNIEFTSTDNGNHAVARAGSKCANRVLDDRVLELDQLKRKEGVTYVKHVGENPIKLIRRAVKDEHNCNPYTVSRDSRDATRNGKLNDVIVNSDFDKYGDPYSKVMAEAYRQKQLNGTSSPIVCNKLAQDCDVQARILIMRNVHDMSPKNAAMACANAGAMVLGAVMMYDQSVFAPGVRSGVTPFCRYAWTRRVICDREYITFKGPQDTQDAYCHLAKTYDAWFKGPRTISVMHKGRRKYFTFEITWCALDHCVISMYPTHGPVKRDAMRLVPQQSNNPYVGIYGYWYDTSHADYGLLVKPRDRDMLTPRVVYVPEDVYLKATRNLAMQSKTFTTDHAIKLVNYCLGEKVDGIPYHRMIHADGGTILFIATHIHKLMYIERYEASKTSSELVKSTTEFRARHSGSLLKRVMKSMRKQKVDRDLQYLSNTGEISKIALANNPRLLSYVNKFLTGKRKHDCEKYRTLLLSCIATFVFDDKGQKMQYTFAQIAQRIEKCWGANKGMDEIGDEDKFRREVVEPTLPEEYGDDTPLHDIPSVKFGENTCLLDSFVAARDEQTGNGDCVTYSEIAERIASSTLIRFVDNGHKIIEALSNDEALPLETLSVLAHEYEVQIVVDKGVGRQKYGKKGPTLYMRYDRGAQHMMPCKRAPECVPSFVKLMPCARLETDSDVVLLDDLISQKREDREGKETWGEDYDTIYMLDNIYSDGRPAAVFDPNGDFCGRTRVLHAFNWTFHTCAQVKHRDVKRYTGIVTPSAIDDDQFWRAAQSNTSFRFDLLLLDFTRDGYDGAPFLNEQLQCVKPGGVFAAVVSMSRADIIARIGEAVDAKFSAPELHTSRNSPILNGKVMIVFRNACMVKRSEIAVFEEPTEEKTSVDRFSKLRSSLRRVKKHISREKEVKKIFVREAPRRDAVTGLIQGMNDYRDGVGRYKQYLRVAINQSGSPENAVESTKQHVREYYPKHVLNSNLTVNQKDKKCFVNRPDLHGLCASPVQEVQVHSERSIVRECMNKLVRTAQTCADMVAMPRFDTPNTRDLMEASCSYRSAEDDSGVEVDVEIHRRPIKEPEEDTIEDDIIVSDHRSDHGGDADIDTESSESAVASDEFTNVPLEPESSMQVEPPVPFSDDKRVANVIPDAEFKSVLDAVNGNRDFGDAISDKLLADWIKCLREYTEYNHRLLRSLPGKADAMARTCASYTKSEMKKAIGASEKDVRMINDRGEDVYIRGCTVSDDYNYVYTLEDDITKRKLMPVKEYDDKLRGCKERVGVPAIVLKEFDPLLAIQYMDKFRDWYAQENLPQRHISIRTIQAVAGAGKSYRMTKEFKKGDLIMVPTRQSQEDTAEKLLMRNPVFAHLTAQYATLDRDEKRAFLRRHIPVKTAYAVLLGNATCKTLWVDEMTTHHRAVIYLCAFRTNAKETICLGDAAQTHVHSRVVGITFEHHRITDVYKPSEYMTETYRCSRSVTQVAALVYRDTGVLGNSMLTTKNRKVGRVGYFQYDPVAVKTTAMKARENGYSSVVLTYTTADKMQMRTLMEDTGIKVYTVTEFQGSEADVVILVRTNSNPKTQGLYMAKDQILTALTRSRLEFFYFTRTVSDCMCRYMDIAKRNA